MNINLSKETLDIIISELENSDREISWEIARLPAYHSGEETDIHRYWKERQSVIKKALSELKRNI